MAKTIKRILVIDDEESIRDGCSQTLTRIGFQVDTTGDAHHGLDLALRDVYAVVLLDLRLPKIDGIELLKRLKGRIQGKVIIITGYGTIPLSVEAMKHGAVDFLTKPFSPQEVKKAVMTALEPPPPPSSDDILEELIGTSDYLSELKDTIKRVARTNSSVLLSGESGTGKEMVASLIHRLSPRSDKAYVAVDCSALVENLMESELFGHVRGAFSGATDSRDGRFQTADKGTIFLDEISNLSPTVQKKLLRVIQEQEVPRVGSSFPEKIDVRLITATNRDLQTLVVAGTFREDLFYRISVVPLHIRPLREHKADILPIAAYYLDFFRKMHATTAKSLSPEAEQSLLAYAWPGNVREVRNTMERLCVLSENTEISLSDILYYGQPSGSKAPVVDAFSGKMTLVDVEKEHIEKALQYFHYQITKTAKFLGIDRKTLRMKIRAYGIRTDAG